MNPQYSWMMIDYLPRTFVYITSAPYFWNAMGLTTAIAIMIGALIYDGHLSDLRKAVVSILSYASMLFLITHLRVGPQIVGCYEKILTDCSSPEKQIAGMATIMIVTFFYTIGIAMGVILFTVKKWR